MSKKIYLKKGENISTRSKRYVSELRRGKKDNGEDLTPAEAGFRIGVLNERTAQAQVYKYKKRRMGVKA